MKNIEYETAKGQEIERFVRDSNSNLNLKLRTFDDRNVID